MTTHIEDVVNVQELIDHLRTARNAYTSHKEVMEQVVENGGHGELITVAGAENMAGRYAERIESVDEMVEAIEDWWRSEV